MFHDHCRRSPWRLNENLSVKSVEPLRSEAHPQVDNVTLSLRDGSIFRDCKVEYATKVASRPEILKLKHSLLPVVGQRNGTAQYLSAYVLKFFDSPPQEPPRDLVSAIRTYDALPPSVFDDIPRNDGSERMFHDRYRSYSYCGGSENETFKPDYEFLDQQQDNMSCNEAIRVMIWSVLRPFGLFDEVTRMNIKYSVFGKSRSKRRIEAA